MSTAGIRLLSSLRRNKSRSSLYDIPAVFFDEDEAHAFAWLREFVEEHKSWPNPNTFRRHTGIETVVTKEPLSYYIDDCRKRALWQSMLQPFDKIKNAIAAKEPDQALALMREVMTASTVLNSQREGLITLADSMAGLMEDYDIAKRQVGLRGVPTGFPFLDESTDGFQNANLYSFVARTGVGKTWMLLSLAMAAHRAGYSVLFLSMEMGMIQIARRAFGLMAGYNPNLIRKGALSTRVEREMRAQIEGFQDDAGAPFYWMVGNFKKTVDALKIAVHEVQPDIIFADASYLLKPSDRTRANARHELLNDVMEGLADITTSCNRPLVQSVQFNRQAIKPKRGADDESDNRNPIAHLALEKIGGTDTVGQISAGVWGLAEGDPPNERRERYCGTLKGREGETGWFKYRYQFQPVDFTQIMDHTQAQRGQDADEPVDMGFMQ